MERLNSMNQLMHSFKGTIVPPGIITAVREGYITSFCLFAFNVKSPEQLRKLTDSLRQAAIDGGHLPPIIGIDQEGGQLIAITNGATELPGTPASGLTENQKSVVKSHLRRPLR